LLVQIAEIVACPAIASRDGRTYTNESVLSRLGLELASTLENGNALPDAADGRPDIEKFCIRLDD